MNVTRAVLPVMRRQRSGHIISISSSAGLAAGFEFVTAYAASKFGLEGWMESLQRRDRAVRHPTTIVNPGFFRTELLTEQSTNYRRAVHRRLRRAHEGRSWSSGSRRTASSPATRRSSRGRWSRSLSQEPPPRRFIAGADAIGHRRAEGRRAEGTDRVQPGRSRRLWRSTDGSVRWRL